MAILYQSSNKNRQKLHNVKYSMGHIDIFELCRLVYESVCIFLSWGFVHDFTQPGAPHAFWKRERERDSSYVSRESAGFSLHSFLASLRSCRLRLLLLLLLLSGIFRFTFDMVAASSCYAYLDFRPCNHYNNNNNNNIALSSLFGSNSISLNQNQSRLNRATNSGIAFFFCRVFLLKFFFF